MHVIPYFLPYPNIQCKQLQSWWACELALAVLKKKRKRKTNIWFIQEHIYREIIGAAGLTLPIFLYLFQFMLKYVLLNRDFAISILDFTLCNWYGHEWMWNIMIMTAKVTPASKVSPLHGASETNTYMCVCVSIFIHRLMSLRTRVVRYGIRTLIYRWGVSCQKGPTCHA